MIAYFEKKIAADFTRLQITAITPRTYLFIQSFVGILLPILIINVFPSIWYVGILCIMAPFSYLAFQGYYHSRKTEGVVQEIRRFYRRYQFARRSNARPEQAIEMAIWDMKFLKKPFQLILHRWGRDIPMEIAFKETAMNDMPAIQTLINMLEVSLTTQSLDVIREQEKLLEREMKLQLEDKQKKDQARIGMIGNSAIITAFVLIVIPFVIDAASSINLIG